MLNERALALGESPSCIRELFHYGKKIKEQCGESAICDFSLGNPATPPPKAVLDAFAALATDDHPTVVHGYTVASGDPEVRAKIAEELGARYQVTLGKEHFFLTAGACPALTAVFGALSISPKSQFVAIAPYFPEYKVLVEGAGASLVIADADYAHFQINFDALSVVITKDTQGVIINSPNNPSGAVYTVETLTRLGGLLREKSEEFGHPIYLISDEPYRELVYDGKVVPFAPAIYPHTIVCYSYSKSLSLPGDRIGYVLVPPTTPDYEKILSAVAGAARMNGHVCAPALLQRVVGACAGACSALDGYDHNRKRLYDALTAMGYRCVYPDGAFYLMVEAPDGDGKSFSDRAKAEGVLGVPCADFGCPAYVRIAYCVEAEVVERALPIFERLLG